MALYGVVNDISSTAVAAVDQNWANAGFGAGNIGVDVVAYAWGGAPGVFLGVGQAAINYGVHVYAQNQADQLAVQTQQTAQLELNTAILASSKIDSLNLAMKQNGCN